MKTAEIRYGGVLQAGDFIGVGSNFSMYFGWYSGIGPGQTVEFISPRNVLRAREELIERLNNRTRKGKDPLAPDSKGLTLNHINKESVKTVNFSRVVKINEPNLIFQDEDKDDYRQAEKILKELKFL